MNSEDAPFYLRFWIPKIALEVAGCLDVPSLRTLLIQLFKRFPINFGLIAAGEMFEV
jgi:hypothetical protein